MNAFLDKIIEQYTRTHPLEEDQITYIKYGLEVVVTTIINIAVIMACAILAGKAVYGLLFMAVFVPTRAFGGGYHSATRLRCNLLILCCEALALWLPDIIAIQREAAVYIFLEWLLYGLIVWKYAPVENTNKPLTIEIRRKNKYRSRILGILWGSLLVLFGQSHIQIAASIATVLMIVAALMVLGVHREKKGNDSNCSM